MKILITGGAGFIGSHLASHYYENGHEIVILDNLRTGNLSNLNQINYQWINGSVTDKLCVEKATTGVDIIFHLAALVSVPQSIECPHETVDINVHGLLNLIESGIKHGAKKIVFASSAAVYGDRPIVPKVEDLLPEPKSPYAISKLDGEYYLNLYRDLYSIETCALRFFNVFGPRQDPKGSYAAAVPIFIEQARRDLPLTIFGSGLQTRDFIYVKDIVTALAFVAENPLSGVFNVGYGSAISIIDMATKICKILNSKSIIQYAPPRPGDVMHSLASNAKLIAAGWQPKYNIDVGLEQTIQYFSKDKDLS